MRLIFAAEWLRFRRSPSNVAIVAVYSLVLLLCALWSVYSAQQHRHAYAQEQAASDALLNGARSHDKLAGAAMAPKDAAMQAFTLARSKAGLAQLPATAGLVLSLSRYDILNTRIAVSVESRYADGRRSDAVTNPALAEAGAMDLGAIMALLMPLVAIGLCAGTRQEDKETGVWRTVCGQSARPWRPFYAALAVRAAALFIPAAFACGLAMALDAGIAAWSTILWWSFCLAAYACFWAALCGALALLPISSAASVLTGLALWLLLTFAIPVGLDAVAAARHPMPSRLAAIIQLREAQQDAEARMHELLDAWYVRHPDWSPRQAGNHTWPVTFLPRFDYQDERLRLLMRRFEGQRLAQARLLEKWAWLSPPMALLLASDHLAGVSPARYATFMSDVERYEQAWRSFFVPRVVSYRGLSEQDHLRVPKFVATAPVSLDALPFLLGQLAFAGGVLIALLLMRRSRTAQSG